MNAGERIITYRLLVLINSRRNNGHSCIHASCITFHANSTSPITSHGLNQLIQYLVGKKYAWIHGVSEHGHSPDTVGNVTCQIIQCFSSHWVSYYGVGNSREGTSFASHIQQWYTRWSASATAHTNWGTLHRAYSDSFSYFIQISSNVVSNSKS